MGLLTAAAAVGALAMGKQVIDAGKARKENQREMQRNITAKREAMRVDNTREDTGANIEVGTDAGKPEERSARRRRNATLKVSEAAGMQAFGVGGL